MGSDLGKHRVLSRHGHLQCLEADEKAGEHKACLAKAQL